MVSTILTHVVCINKLYVNADQFVILKPLRYCFKETFRFDVKDSFARRPVSRLTKPGNIKKNWGKAIQFHGTFHGLKITNCDVGIIDEGVESDVAFILQEP